VILSVDGRKVVRPDDLARLISIYRPGQRVTLEVLHSGGERENVEITLGRRPDNPIG
jgi:S1-C subfamily serine protease